MSALQMFFSWLASADPAVQITTIIVAGIVFVFAFSNDSVHGFIKRKLK